MRRRPMMCVVRAMLWAALVGAGCSFEAPVLELGEDLGTAEMGADLVVVSDQGGSGDLDQSFDPDQADVPDLVIAPDLGADAGVDADQDTAEMGEPDQGGPQLMECGGELVDPLVDAANCGGCGVACDPKFGACVGGSCSCTREGMEVCGDRCEDVQWDPNNCGLCGVECGPAAACIRGECKCKPGFTMCGGTCVDKQTDPGNCGGCGMSCGGKACKNGSCRSNDRCDIGWGQCGMGGGVACLESMEQDLHCRGAFDFGCGSVCGGDEVCRRGGAFDPPRCHSVRLGRGCEQCPCDDCAGGESCEFAPSAVSRVWCVD
jgi:hypothetical protein